jgi:hypothetical protein
VYCEIVYKHFHRSMHDVFELCAIAPAHQQDGEEGRSAPIVFYGAQHSLLLFLCVLRAMARLLGEWTADERAPYVRHLLDECDLLGDRVSVVAPELLADSVVVDLLRGLEDVLDATVDAALLCVRQSHGEPATGVCESDTRRSTPLAQCRTLLNAVLSVDETLCVLLRNVARTALTVAGPHYRVCEQHSLSWRASYRPCVLFTAKHLPLGVACGASAAFDCALAGGLPLVVVTPRHTLELIDATSPSHSRPSAAAAAEVAAAAPRVSASSQRAPAQASMRVLNAYESHAAHVVALSSTAMQWDAFLYATGSDDGSVKVCVCMCGCAPMRMCALSVSSVACLLFCSVCVRLTSSLLVFSFNLSILPFSSEVLPIWRCRIDAHSEGEHGRLLFAGCSDHGHGRVS